MACDATRSPTPLAASRLPSSSTRAAALRLASRRTRLAPAALDTLPTATQGRQRSAAPWRRPRSGLLSIGAERRGLGLDPRTLAGAPAAGLCCGEASSPVKRERSPPSDRLSRAPVHLFTVIRLAALSARLDGGGDSPRPFFVNRAPSEPRLVQVRSPEPRKPAPGRLPAPETEANASLVLRRNYLV
eukprot:CAMPEP_0206153482 /NCGR_PEP_ID=MMETSP1474-20131121/665_1 /ASSEMBLY_ACC=CAM_ASM_001110 /TAXON_ID=97495 /ORGANISM="Imantonia sp., Strain RCC918" /LENGTH=186 /DNA_ID=CAMNT_0053551315 /DNA_START=224 /DNA_END=783 /DNA_ORIENTATION=-